MFWGGLFGPWGTLGVQHAQHTYWWILGPINPTTWMGTIFLDVVICFVIYIDSMNIPKSNRLRKHGFGSLHNLT